MTQYMDATFAHEPGDRGLRWRVPGYDSIGLVRSTERLNERLRFVAVQSLGVPITESYALRCSADGHQLLRIRNDNVPFNQYG